MSLEGDRLIRQAMDQAPRHPLVMGEVAARKLADGDAAGAYALLKDAVAVEPDDVSLWMNMAAALRRLERPDEEQAALDKVLALEPRNLWALLQAATVHEIKGDTRAAAAVYRTALQSVPQGVDLPSDMRAHLRHAQAQVQANELQLEGFLEDRLRDLRTQYADDGLQRFDKCMATLLRKQPIYRQKPTFMYFPHLPAIEFHDRRQFPWLDTIEAATADIRAELINVLADGPTSLEPYVSMQVAPQEGWRELNNSRRWGVHFLWKAGEACAENLARCPKTAEALEAWPQCDLAGSGPSAVFSILDARTRIPPHTGVNNTRLIVHLPLIVPPGCGFRVGAETREWIPGQAFVFDDTIEHEAWNDSDDPRAVLIFDIWNPLVSPHERELVNALTRGVGDFYGALPAYV